MSSNSIRIVVKQINSNNIEQSIVTAITNQHFCRVYQLSGTTWSEWTSLNGASASFHVYLKSPYSRAGGSWSLIPVNTILFDTHNGFNVGTYLYTVPLAGLWFFGSKIYWNSQSTADLPGLAFYYNGDATQGSFQFYYGNASNTAFNNTIMIKTSVRDVIGISYYNSSDCTIMSGVYGTCFYGFYLG